MLSERTSALPLLLLLGVLVGIGLVMSSGDAAAQGRAEAQAVTVVNTPLLVSTPPKDPLFVTEMAVEPVQTQGTCSATSNLDHCNAFTYHVPPGKRLVIETVTIWGSVPAGQSIYGSVNTMISGDGGVHYISSSLPGLTTPSKLTVSQPMRLYSDQSTQVQVMVLRTPAQSNATLYASMSGYLVPCPTMY